MSGDIGYKWKPIEELPRGYESLGRSDLLALHQVWEGLRERLRTVEFVERLQRQWAIETGKIERVYDLDRGITETLIERGIDAALIPHGSNGRNPEQVAAIINDQIDAIQMLFDFVKGERELTTGYIKELHALLTRNQPSTTAVNSFGRAIEVPLLRGDYKKLPNNPTRKDGLIHEYCPPEQVASEMDRLVDLHRKHVEDGVPTEVEAAWLHHRFAQIHPFQDGNGRVARALATLVFLRAGWFPLAVTDDDRSSYISALEEADGGDLRPLIDLFANVLRRSFTQAFSAVGDMERERRIGVLISEIKESREVLKGLYRPEWEHAKVVADGLIKVAVQELDRTVMKLRAEFQDGFRFDADASPQGGGRKEWFKEQVDEVARKTGYRARVSDYHSWARLTLISGVQMEILISIHGLEPGYFGFLGASGAIYKRSETESGSRVSDIRPLSQYEFSISFADSIEKSREPFMRWLDDCLSRGLEIWGSEL